MAGVLQPPSHVTAGVPLLTCSQLGALDPAPSLKTHFQDTARTWSSVVGSVLGRTRTTT